jgi:hypothetical protein
MNPNRQIKLGLKALPPRQFPLSLCGARGEGRGEGLVPMAQAAAPLIRPSATFSPRCAKGEGFTHARLGGSRSGVALVATLIMLSLVTFMVVAFLGVARRERRAIEAATTAGESQIARDAALNVAQADILARLLISGDKWNYGVMVSTNFQNTTNVTGTISPLNVNHTNALAAGVNPWLTNLGNLQYKPRPPVFSPNFTNTRAFPAPGSPINVLLSESRSGRFYLDFNRNGIFDPTDRTHAGDPHWIGQLEYPEVSHGPTNRFVSRYAYLIAPAGKAMDLNFIHNASKHPGTFGPVSYNDGYLRNLGVGPHEFNLAALLTELAPGQYFNNAYNIGAGTSGSGNWFNSNDPYRDALAVLLYRINDHYANQASLLTQFGAASSGLLTGAGFDLLGNGPLMTNFTLTVDLDSAITPWSAGSNTSVTARRYFDFVEIYNTNGRIYAPFTANLQTISTNLANTLAGDTDRRAPYRLMEVLGTESWPVTNKLNLNWLNNPLGGTAGGEAFGFTNWSADTFFYSTAELMLRASLIPSVFVNTNWTGFGGAETNVLVTNYYFGTTFVGTNINSTLSLTNIPIFPFSYYLPETHRLLQFTANLFDATTTNNASPAYPTLWRPVFGFANTNLWPTNDFINIVGYTTNGTDTNLLSLPVYDLSDPNARMQMYTTAGGTIGASNLCLFAGTPVIIGAKKGYPNFNEFASQVIASMTRKIRFVKTNTNVVAGVIPGPLSASPVPLAATNQNHILSFYTVSGIEAWNSYSATFPPAGRTFQISVTNISTIVLTNERSFTNGPIFTQTITNGTNLIIGPSTWAGISGSAPSFRSFLFTNVPTLALTNYTGGPNPYFAGALRLPGYAYSTNYQPYPGLSNGGFVVSGFSTFIQPPSNGVSVFPDLRLGVVVSNSVQYALYEPANNRVVDFVILSGLTSAFDLASLFSATNGNVSEDFGDRLRRFWLPQRLLNSTNPTVPTLGFSNQFSISTNINRNYVQTNSTEWFGWQGSAAVPQARQVRLQIERFRRFLGLPPTVGDPELPPNQTMPVRPDVADMPYSPTRVIAITKTWEVNDPLVHYIRSDIESPYRSSPTAGLWRKPVAPVIATPPPPGTVYSPAYPDRPENYPNRPPAGLNKAYAPWGRLPFSGDVAGFMPNYRGIAPGAYDQRLKDPGIFGSDAWDFPQRKFANLGWIGRVHRGTPWQTFYLKSDIPHPTNWFYWAHSTDTMPTNDWRLVDVFTTAVNADATRGLLSVNQTNSLAWAAALGGTLVLSNSGTAIIPVAVAPASAQLTNIVGSLTNGLINAKQRIPMWQPVLNYSPGDVVAHGAFYVWNPATSTYVLSMSPGYPVLPATFFYRALLGTNQNISPLTNSVYWTNVPSWNLSGIYAQGDIVERLGVSYYALKGTPLGPPEAVPSDWEPYPQRSFTRVGSVLSTPELSVQSPFINGGRPWVTRNYLAGERVYWQGWYYQATRNLTAGVAGPPDTKRDFHERRGNGFPMLGFSSVDWWPLEAAADAFYLPDSLNDVFVERIPQQTLGLMHLEPHPRMVIYAYGQSLRPAERGVNVAPGTYSLMVTNYQVTGESAARAVVRIEGLPEPGLLPRPLPAGAPPVVTPRVFMESFKLLPEF